MQLQFVLNGRRAKYFWVQQLNFPLINSDPRLFDEYDDRILKVISC